MLNVVVKRFQRKLKKLESLLANEYAIDEAASPESGVLNTADLIDRFYQQLCCKMEVSGDLRKATQSMSVEPSTFSA